MAGKISIALLMKPVDHTLQTSALYKVEISLFVQTPMLKSIDITCVPIDLLNAHRVPILS